jgi:hypothetical protein
MGPILSVSSAGRPILRWSWRRIEWRQIGRDSARERAREFANLHTLWNYAGGDERAAAAAAAARTRFAREKAKGGPPSFRFDLITNFNSPKRSCGQRGAHTNDCARARSLTVCSYIWLLGGVPTPSDSAGSYERRRDDQGRRRRRCSRGTCSLARRAAHPNRNRLAAYRGRYNKRGPSRSAAGMIESPSGGGSPGGRYNESYTTIKQRRRRSDRRRGGSEGSSPPSGILLL